MMGHGKRGWTKAIVFLMCLVLGACAQSKMEPPPQAKPAAARTSALSKAQTLDLQKKLAALGYDIGRPDGLLGPKTVAALRAYEKDRGLPVKGALTPALLAHVQASWTAHTKELPTVFEAGATYTYSDGNVEKVLAIGSRSASLSINGTERREKPLNFLLETRPGTQADAPPDFLLPLAPGTSGSFAVTSAGTAEIGARIACTVEGAGQTSVPAGTFATTRILCQESRHGTLVSERRWHYARALCQVVKETVTTGGVSVGRELVAIQPSTEAWPTPARAGLDWSIVTALQSGPADGAPRTWSSSGVQRRFSIEVAGPIDAARWVSTDKGITQCKRYALKELRAKSSPGFYPAMACLSDGTWRVPSRSPYVFAAPPKGASLSTLQRAAEPPLAGEPATADR